MSDLLQALYRGDHERVDELRSSQPELNVFEAAALGDAERLRTLLDADPSLANAWAQDGFQPLGLACFFGHVEATRLLVERSAQVNSASRNQMRVMPLHSAAATGNPDARYQIAEILLQAGADPNAKQQDDFTPLLAADQHGDARLRKLLEQHGATRG